MLWGCCYYSRSFPFPSYIILFNQRNWCQKQNLVLLASKVKGFARYYNKVATSSAIVSVAEEAIAAAAAPTAIVIYSSSWIIKKLVISKG